MVLEQPRTSWRPRFKISTDYESNNSAVADMRATNELNDGLMKSRCLEVSVRGHRTNDGLVWTPGMRVALWFPQLGIREPWLLMSRKLRGGRDTGKVTDLTFYPDGLWQVDAHPHSRVQRKAKLAASASGTQP